MYMLKEKIAIIGTEQDIPLGMLMVKVTVLDYKQSYGKDRWLVTPVSGDGQVWVEKDFTKSVTKKK